MSLKINSKILFTMVIIFTIVNILDVITAMFILPGESNIIYLLTHSISMLWILKFVFIGLIVWVYFKNEYPSRFWLFSYIYVLFIGIFLIGLGVYSNIMGILNPAIVETASQISTIQKAQYYVTIVGFLFVIPYTISMIAFKIFDIVERKIRYEVKKIK